MVRAVEVVQSIMIANWFLLLVERLFYEIAAELIEQARQKGGLSRNHHDSSVTNLGMKNNLGNFQSSCCGGSGSSN